ncbi:MAG: sulfatase-like hydrolase/transferase [Gemmataceae bacterium]
MTIRLCLLGFVFLGLLPANASAVGKKPNVLFLVTDDQRADTIAALGNDVIKTPHLDKLVNQGYVFRNLYCMGSTVGAVCNPSRHMFLSGKALYSYNPKIQENTFGAVMRALGYITFHISKRGNTAKNYHKAFEFSGYLNDGKDRRSGHHGRTAVDSAIKFLKTTWKKDRPLFMYIGFAGPHDPRVAAKKWLNLYDRNKIPLPKNYMPFHPFNNGDMKIRDERLAPWPRTEEVVRKHLHDYYGCISSIDHNIGRLLTTLQQLGELENTIILFTSDHGLAIGSHGLFGKQSLYQHSMNSPCIIAGKGIPHGTSDALVYLFDLFPTAVDLVGGKIPQGLDGKSLAPIIRGQEKQVRDTVFLAYKNVQRAVRKGDWKLIRYPHVNVTQLFDLSQDPNEMKNLAKSPQYANKVAELMGVLKEQQKLFRDKAPLSVDNPEPAKVDESFFKNAKKGKKRRSKKKKNSQVLYFDSAAFGSYPSFRSTSFRRLHHDSLFRIRPVLRCLSVG